MATRTTRRATKKTATKKTATKKTAAKKTGRKGNAAGLKKAQEAKAAKAAERQKELELLRKENDRKLPAMAKEINVRLTKAEKLEHDADDHRLAAALVLGEAKTRCEAAKQSFKDWSEANLVEDGRSFETIRKLARVGQADNPQLALDDMRGRNAERNKEARERNKQKQISQGKSTAPQTSKVEVVEKTFDALGERGQRNVLQSLAAKTGMTVMDQDKVRELNERASAKPAPTQKTGSGGSAQEAAEEAFRRMTGKQKMAFLSWAAEEIGAEITFFEGAETKGDKSAMDIPASLRRGGTKKATAKKGTRTRRTKRAA